MSTIITFSIIFTLLWIFTAYHMRKSRYGHQSAERGYRETEEDKLKNQSYADWHKDWMESREHIEWIRNERRRKESEIE